MTLHHDDGIAIPDRATIARCATQHDSAVFAVVDEEKDKFVETYTSRTYSLWGRNAPTSAQMVHTATMGARRGRTCASSNMVVAGMRQSAMQETDP